ncbi:MAG TPA: TonB-dependent receptor [Oxalicibacterium sp.]|uniref:TonB-dependent receptor plug domain-containing protein n=1 Tax=Oxalicibacterium sp. TaxID=2766525 RepID=UPI002BDAEFEE|nr:TonB-dependent receptor [Oxalicibacterium sp.]HWU98488.1 TonB-dependent receptor [Oxalicibacterium sp.]
MSIAVRLPVRLRLTVLSLATLVTCHARADADGDLLTLPLEALLNLEVSTASKFSQDAADAPSAVTVATASDIKAYGWRTLADILANMPGLYVTNDGNYSYLGGRGFARPGDYNTRFLLLVDGVRSNDALYDQASIGREFIVDVDMIARVEYAPGSGSSIYGSNAFFGVINVITKSAAQAGRPQGAIEIGSQGERKASASVAVRDKGGAQLLLSATRFTRGGEDQYYPEFDTPGTNGGVAHDLDYERGGNVFVKGTMGPFTVALAHVERERGIPTASFVQTFNDPRARTKDTQTNAALTYRTDLADQTALMARAFWGELRYDGVYAYEDQLNLDHSHSAWVGTEISLLTTRWKNHKLLGGIEIQRDYQRQQQNADEYPAGSLAAPTYSDEVQRVSLLDSDRPGSRVGIYLQDEITLSDTLLLNVGGRHDYNSEVPGAFSPRLALIYKPRSGTTLKAIAGSAFRAPNAYEMYYSVDTDGGQKANTDLKSERIHSRELVLEHQFNHDTRVVMSAFRNKVTDLISQTEDTDGRLVFRNLEGATAKGLEVQLEHGWQNGIKLRASQSWQKTTDAATGERLVNSPTQLSKFNLLLPVSNNMATVGIEARYIGARETLNGSTDGYWVANATLFSAKLIEQVEVSFSIYNMFDKQYGDPGGEELRQNTIPQPGRAYRLRVSKSF